MGRIETTASIYLEQLIAKRLEELLPGFDPVVLDNKLYKTCIEDSIYYLAVTWRLDLKDVRYRFNEILGEKGLKLKEELDVWLSLWLIHWRKRVKLILNDEEYNRHMNHIQKLEMKGISRIGNVLAKNFRAPVIEALIHHGEICFVTLLANQIISKTGRAYPNKSLKTDEDRLNFLNLILKRVKDMSGMLGPLIFMKVGNAYFRKVT